MMFKTSKQRKKKKDKKDIKIELNLNEVQAMVNKNIKLVHSTIMSA